MALNTIATAAMFQKELDKQAIELLTSSFMDENAGNVIYQGGKEIKIPKISLTGLKNYTRSNGYPQGSVVLEYQTVEMTMDRGMKFSLDSMDIDEGNFVMSAGEVLGEFQRTKVVPEVDAYRYSKIASLTGVDKVEADHDEKKIYKAICDDIAFVQDKVGESTPLVLCINGVMRGKLNASSEFSKSINVAEFKVGEINTRVRLINDVPIISVPSNRMYTAYTFKDDNTGGFEKKADAKLINWIVMPRQAVVAVCKQDKGKIIPPDENQVADAWLIAYRKYHDMWVKDSMLSAVRVNVATA